MAIEHARIVTQHPFLDGTACNSFIATLDQHCELALDRNPTQPGTYVTYGRATYIDVCLPSADPERDYYRCIAESNLSLQAILGDFYEQLRLRIEGLLGESVVYEPELLALPGIHIFRGSGILGAGEAGSHFDVQYQQLRLPSPPDPGVSPISFTIPLRVPTHGTGLQVYNVTYADYERAYHLGRISTLEQLVRRKTSAYIPYRVGNLVLHRGLIVHSITSPDPIAPDDERITVQGHGIRCGRTWILYW